MTISSSTLPNLPLTCLTSAEELTTHEAFQGQDTIIDFWTTKCTRCPDALDKLNAMASDANYAHFQFVSICCDQLDGAREILQATNEPKWNNVKHYFMSREAKEEAKTLLGFKSVPFYVIINKNGIMMQKGSKVDFNTILMEKENVVPQSNMEKSTPVVEKKMNREENETQPPAIVSPERVLTIDLDFDF